MAGTFAHITLVDTLCQEGSRLESIPNLTSPMRHALRTSLKFCELGAVSPDCPFLKKTDKSAEGWGNVMHYWKTADFVRRSVPYLAGQDITTPDNQKCLAWLFGYTAHLVTDLTIHPVLAVKGNVGEYKGHEREHRVWELHQDVYIFHEKKKQQPTEAEFLRSCGIADCGDEADRGMLHPAIARLWRHCLDGTSLQDIRMDATIPSTPPDPDGWFTHYVLLIDKVAEEGGRIPLRSKFEHEGLLYPDLKDLNPKYIENVKTPSGVTIHYKQLFEKAVENTARSWADLALALTDRVQDRFALKNANLDTGLDDAAGQSVYWS